MPIAQRFDPREPARNRRALAPLQNSNPTPGQVLFVNDAGSLSWGTLTDTANQITITVGVSTITFSLPSDLIIPGTITIPNTGLHLLDTNASHDLIIKPGSNLTADRTLTLTTADSDRTVTISGNTTISQDYSTTGIPQFAGLGIGTAGATNQILGGGTLTIQSGSTNNLLLRSGSSSGAIQLRPGADSAGAVIVEDSSGTDIIGVNTTSGVVTIIGKAGSGALRTLDVTNRTVTTNQVTAVRSTVTPDTGTVGNLIAVQGVMNYVTGLTPSGTIYTAFDARLTDSHTSGDSNPGTLRGLYMLAVGNNSGSATSMQGGRFEVGNSGASSSGTVTTAAGVSIFVDQRNGSGTATYTSAWGTHITRVHGGTNAAGLFIANDITVTTGTNANAIASDFTGASYLTGSLAIGGNVTASGQVKCLMFGGAATLGAATADVVSMTGEDDGAGNRCAKIQTELGGVTIIGNNAVRIPGGTNGQYTNIRHLTELTTIAAAAFTDTAIQIPANAIVLSVSVRVTVVIPTAATFTVTGATSTTQFDTAGGVAAAATTTDAGTQNCPYKNGAAQAIRITPDLTPAANTGRVRVTISYIEITSATS